MADPPSWITTAGKAAAKYLRAYPLRQLALAAVLFVPFHVVIRLALAVLGTEQALVELAGGWGIQVMAAGLALVTAFFWIALGTRGASNAKRKARANAREKAKAEREVQRERWRAVVRGLNEGDKVILRRFVDQRRIQFEGRDLVPGDEDTDALQRIQALGIFGMYWPYSRLEDAVFDLLLAEPALVGSNAQPTQRIRAN
ncbi:hypothetical protein V1318_13115 [Lysobacter sp. CCNWLW3]|uniref:hypothetical protein n=1 Tax=unclassified Lysobacter TaxID=2635362 RepID=UPI002FD6A692